MKYLFKAQCGNYLSYLLQLYKTLELRNSVFLYFI